MNLNSQDKEMRKHKTSWLITNDSEVFKLEQKFQRSTIF